MCIRDSHGTVEWRLFNSTLHAGEAKANIILAMAISAQGINQKMCIRDRKRPQYVFRPNLNDPQHRRAWELLQQVPSARRKEFLVQAILATEQTDRLEESIRKVVRAELQAASITTSVSSQPPENAIPDSALDFLNSL